ncbi:MAG: methylated-DNA-protein-cysteine methyltransferase-like protein [Rhodothermales bacterium]|jgi:methylated-DNA-protein-cysteine methyltransferase-like protein
MSKDRSDFFDRVYEVVALIPPGKVTTYGLIAQHLGLKSAARTVGWALNGGVASGLPCHRVVNRFGALSGRLKFSNQFAMEDQLRNEGVAFLDDGTVDMTLHLWDPDEALGRKDA